jgi:hypothetical protein
MRSTVTLSSCVPVVWQRVAIKPLGPILPPSAACGCLDQKRCGAQTTWQRASCRISAWTPPEVSNARLDHVTVGLDRAVSACRSGHHGAKVEDGTSSPCRASPRMNAPTLQTGAAACSAEYAHDARRRRRSCRNIAPINVSFTVSADHPVGGRYHRTAESCLRARTSHADIPPPSFGKHPTAASLSTISAENRRRRSGLDAGYQPGGHRRRRTSVSAVDRRSVDVPNMLGPTASNHLEHPGLIGDHRGGPCGTVSRGCEVAPRKGQFATRLTPYRAEHWGCARGAAAASLPRW